ncbi:mycothiol transferase [Pseudofrankia asymbiotica]|uniref:DUF664 domain-containing protein n=1 Tax=Pseudofrankia asymbiotica TaxID=1834516 RepID=A0A1V2IET7_9ACTN|nr:DUF664 domain-containing protein [Pseudofrankia asymbiotica]ONH30951.1 hypothetical protein BL253_11280 [Pseudofrankia asymbiotica]
MASSADLLVDGFGRVREVVHGAVDGLSAEQLNHRLDGRANSITWLVWHLARVQDDHVADVAGTEQVWTSAGWYGRFGLPLPPESHGYGHTSAQVDGVRVGDPALLTDYYDAVHDATLRFVAPLTDPDLDRVVDAGWDPPVTLGVRLVSVIADDLQHAGQAALIRGLLLAT